MNEHLDCIVHELGSCQALAFEMGQFLDYLWQIHTDNMKLWVQH